MIVVTTIKTCYKMYASLRTLSDKERNSFISFYKRFKENGIKKYRVEVIK